MKFISPEYFQLISKLQNTHSISRELFISIAKTTASFKPMSKPLIKLEFPKIDFKEFSLDYANIREVTEKNSNHGWTLTLDMDINTYLDDDLLIKTADELDTVFLEYFRSDDFSPYKREKTNILAHINTKWNGTLNECFKLYELGYFKTQIPLLITIVEGEIADFTNLQNFIGKGLISNWKQSLDTQGDNLDALVLFSLFYFLEKGLFERDDFRGNRNPTINRNRILHGRDNPNHWNEADYFKLINTLSSIQTCKEIIMENI